MTLVDFWMLCSTNGIILDLEQREQFERYIGELQYWNEKINLVSRKDMENLIEHHIMHSLSIVKYFDFKEKAKILDIGTGGGLPGIPVAIACPHVKMTLCDSMAKKVKVTEMFAKHTGIKTIRTIRERVEDLANEQRYKGYMDAVIARGVARLVLLATWSKPLLTPNGEMIFLKGGDLSGEIAEAKEAFPKLDVKEIPIKIFGLDYYEKEEKKILHCKFVK